MAAGKIRGQTRSKDTMTRLFFQVNSHFAEVYNHTYFRKCPFSPDDLEDQDTAEVSSIRLKNGNSIKLQQYRDVCKLLKRGAMLNILGLESQTHVDWLMVFRTMVLEVINYARQVAVITDANKAALKTADALLSGFLPENKLIPCQTLVIYYGKEPWTAPTSLSELFADDVSQIGVNDWKIQVIDVRRMSEKEIASYGPEMKAFFAFIKHSEDPDQILQVIHENEPVFKNLSELTYDTLTELTNSPELRKLKEKYRTAEGGIDVCAGITGLVERAKNNGQVIGVQQGVKQGVKQGEEKYSRLILKLAELKRNDDILKAAQSVRYRNKLYTEFGIT